MRARRRRANKIDTQLLRELPRLDVEIVNDLHVIGNKTNRRDNDIRQSLTVKLSQVVAYVRTEPRLRRRSAATLINDLPVVVPKLFGNQTCRFVELRSVITIRSHRFRNAVRGEREMRPCFKQLEPRSNNAIDVCFNEQGVIVEPTQLLDLWRVNAD